MDNQLVRQEYRHRRVREHALGRPTQDEFTKTRMAVSPHHHQIGGMGRRVGTEDRSDTVAGSIDTFEDGVDAM